MDQSGTYVAKEGTSCLAQEDLPKMTCTFCMLHSMDDRDTLRLSEKKTKERKEKAVLSKLTFPAR